MLRLIFSILAGFKISEWICGPWIDPKLFEDHSEPDQGHNMPQQSFAPPTYTSKKTKWKGIEFEEDMKHLDD